MGRQLSLDQIWSATSHFSIRWSEGLESNKAHRVLHYLLCRLWDEGRGQLVNAQLTLAQTTLSRKLGISRQWIGQITSRLEHAGWIEHESSKLPDGTNSSSVWRVGRMLKRLLVMLGKSQRNLPTKDTAKIAWHFSPLVKSEKVLSTVESENSLPHPETLLKIPLLSQWLRRGEK